MAPPDAERLIHRYALLTALRWLPTGLLVPIMVLLARARGLDVTTIGATVALYSLTAAALELPTGGLGDTVGRRWVLVAAGCCLAASTLLLAVAQGAALFAAAAVLRGAGRALGSGPLEAWLVDDLRAERDEDRSDLAEPAAHDGLLARGLAAGHVAESVALAVGVVVSGVLVSVAVGLPADGSALLVRASIPALAAAAVTVVWVAALLAYLPGGRPPHTTVEEDADGEGGEANRTGVGPTIARALTLAHTDPPLRRLLLRTVAIGVTLATFELFVPLVLADRVADPARAASLFAALAAGAFVATAVGSALAPAAGRALGSPGSAAAWATAAVVPCTLLVTADGTAVLAAAYLAAYAGLGVAGPLAATLLHGRVDSGERATVLSIESLALQCGGLVATLVLPRLLGITTWAPWLVAAAVLAAAVPATLTTTRPAVDRPAGDQAPLRERRGRRSRRGR